MQKDRRFVKYRTKDMSSETANAWKVAKIEELKSSTAKKQAFVDGERREYFEKVEVGGGRVSAKQAVDAVKEDGRREETQGGIFYDDALWLKNHDDRPATDFPQLHPERRTVQGKDGWVEGDDGTPLPRGAIRLIDCSNAYARTTTNYDESDRYIHKDQGKEAHESSIYLAE